MFDMQWSPNVLFKYDQYVTHMHEGMYIISFSFFDRPQRSGIKPISRNAKRTFQDGRYSVAQIAMNHPRTTCLCLDESLAKRDYVNVIRFEYFITYFVMHQMCKNVDL